MTDLIVVPQAAHWQRLKRLVLDSVSSPITRRVYNLGLDEFFAWYGQDPRPGFTKATVCAWRVATGGPRPWHRFYQRADHGSAQTGGGSRRQRAAGARVGCRDHAREGGRVQRSPLGQLAIREHSVAGTNRVAQSGAWMGGVVPFGYRKVGTRSDARLIVSEDKIPGNDLSEADVIRMIYRLAAVERRSCFFIAERLNELGIPCAYQRDERLVTRGKRKQRTSGLWRPGRVRNIIVNTSYKGLHEFGKRAKTKRELITRTVPAIVDAKTWDLAQANLQSHFLFGVRSTRNQYLLRGLMKCSLCDLTYIGVANTRPSGKREFYYRCNGTQGARALYGKHGERCASKAIQGEELEKMVWADVQEFLRKPSVVIEQLRARMRNDANDTVKDRQRLIRLRALLEGKAGERNKVVGLYRKSLLNDAELARQLDEIDKEAAGLATQIEKLESKQGGVDSNALAVENAEALLTRLRERLDQPMTYERKRQLVELLVGDIRIDTIRTAEKRENVVTVTYRFPSAVDI
jgi:site-specific DNA recombinase